ncbi:MAG: RidA family protein [Cyanobacteria bacterium NC_groundwater_1444_Ag_S-0.65um_54_12]|nr:RidA family protein [Cyanobacteria bacterium NC_groundwater_1444_Ag_S-0.65um_54_12]
MALERLQALGLQLPSPTMAIANYLPYQIVEHEIYVSGQLPLRDGQVVYQGLLGDELTVAEGYQAARLCALSALGQIASAAGSLENIQIIRVGGFVASAAGFTEQSQVLNGASDLLVAVLGERGRHARVAVGVAALPRNAAVEVEIMARIIAGTD